MERTTRTPRRRTTNALRAAAGAAVVAGFLVPTPAGAVADQVLADWRMNEPRGATVMTDRGPHGIEGEIGSRVRTGIDFSDGSTGYQWSRRRPNAQPAVPERLIVVDDPRLNPGTRDYAITLRFQTTRRHGNIIQKGQSRTPGGYFKLELPKGRMTCLFRSRDAQGNLIGQAFVKSPRDVNLHDGRWHVVRCEKTSDRVTMTIDGETTVQSRARRIGPIANDEPLTIAGKIDCDQIDISCDYFGGSIDYIRIETS